MRAFDPETETFTAELDSTPPFPLVGLVKKIDIDLAFIPGKGHQFVLVEQGKDYVLVLDPLNTAAGWIQGPPSSLSKTLASSGSN